MEHNASVVLPTELNHGYGVTCTCGWDSQVFYLEKAFAYKLAVLHEMSRVDELLPSVARWERPR